MLNKIFISLSLLFFFTTTVACAESGKKPEIKKSPASNPSCTVCDSLVNQGKEVLSQLNQSEKEFDPENYELMLKQSKVRKEIIDLAYKFLEDNSIEQPGVLDAIISIWTPIVDYERNSEFAESNFKFFKPSLAKVHLKLAQKLTTASTDDEKRRLEKIKTSLTFVEAAEKGEPQDSPE